MTDESRKTEEPAQIKSSEDIIADLLNDVKSSEKPFSVQKLAGCAEADIAEKKKKSKKHHKHKSKKKKSRDDRSRSRSPSKKRKKHKRSRSRSSSRDSSKKSKKKSVKKEEIPNDPENKKNPVFMPPKPQPFAPPSKSEQIDEDDMPLGADFRTAILSAKKDTKLSINIKTVLPKPAEQSAKPEVKEEGEVENEKTDRKSDTSASPDENKRKRRRSRSSSADTDDRIERRLREKSRRKSSRENRRSRSRHRSRRRDETPPRDRNRRRGDSRGRDRYSGRRSYSRDRMDRRRDYEDYRRRRSRSREIVDKEKLLAIAKKKRSQMLANGEFRDTATVDDFVTYCQKLQKRQEKEKRREKGEAVSDNDSDEGEITYKHPYAIPKDPIRINIVSATTSSLAQKALMAPEEKEIDPTQLRLVFPVSSGAVHKENAEWTPVTKDDVIPKSCSVEQKRHVALTSVEIERCRNQGIPVSLTPAPTFLNSILPPPPPPPQFLPNPDNRNGSITPPPLPPVLYIPPKEKMIIKEPSEYKTPAPNDISATLKQRADAQKRLTTNPNDFEAHRALREANEKMEAWAALKSLPGKYTGSTGLRLLTPDELQPHNPKYHAWVKRDQFKNAQPQIGGVGMRLMEKMGWKPGEGLGKDALGNVEPLVLDVKSDRRGLIAEEEMSIKQRNKLNASNNVPVDLSNKNPISLLMEFCAKRHFDPPSFTCDEIGKDHQKMFIWTVVVNGVAYTPLSGSRQKKEGKGMAAHVALQSIGILPRDPSLPVVM